MNLNKYSSTKYPVSYLIEKWGGIKKRRMKKLKRNHEVRQY